MKVLLLVVTMTGTSEMIAEDIVEAYGAEHEFDLQLIENTEPAILSTNRNLIVISSTYGTGDVPDPGQPFFMALESSDLNLAHLNYGVIALGDDKIYHDTFANGGRQWDALLRRRQANSVTEPLLLDSAGSDDISELAVDWSAACLAALKSTIAA
ncbi:flavodoxin domain-containing protein [Pusillimonas noertemannii]|uniref:flavodoxin domain-containing protein n=1 Tax=Pusillimonas noertemannii TaxID=305977 RepID=UPI00333F7A44